MIESDEPTAWIQTAGGRKVYPLKLRAADIYVSDLIHALPNLCRFTGHCREFYSVAQHLVLVSIEAERIARAAGLGDVDATLAARWGALHDAAEVYFHDLPRPLKRHPALKFYREAEHGGSLVVADRFGLSPCLSTWPKISEVVAEADTVLLSTEARDLMSPLHPDWTIKPPKYRAIDEVITPLDPRPARELFRARIIELGLAY
jgi:uncharacterized protein